MVGMLSLDRPVTVAVNVDVEKMLGRQAYSQQ